MVLGLWSFQFLTMMRRGIFYSFLYIYLFSLMGNVTTTAALGTLTMLMSSLGQNIVWGGISDRYRLRAKLIVIGEVVAGFTYIVVFLTHKFFIDANSNIAAGLVLIIGLAILEFFWSMSDVGWAALVTDITTTKTRGNFVGAINFVVSIGRMTGTILAGFLYADGLGFRQGTIFYISTLILFIGATIMWFVSRTVKPSQTSTSSETETTKNSNNGVQNSSNVSVENERIFFWFLISLAIVVLGVASVSQVFPLFLILNDGLHATDLEVSFILAAWTLGGMIASIAAGRLADKMGRITVILAGFSIAAATPLFYGLAPNVAIMALAYGTNGVAFMMLQTAGFALAGDIIPGHKRGRLLSQYNAVMALSWGPAGLLIGGPISDIQTSLFGVSAHTAYINAFIASSGLILLGIFVFIIQVRRLMQ
jgi:MFS family permease